MEITHQIKLQNINIFNEEINELLKKHKTKSAKS